MLRGVTRLSTPVSLMGIDDDGNLTDIDDPRVYREMHGYIPVPHSPQRMLFDDVATRKQSEFVVVFGAPASFRDGDDSLQVRIDLLSREMASDKLVKSFTSTGTKLFDGPLGEEICASSGTVCGIGIVCFAPDNVTVERLQVHDIVSELRAEIEALFAVPESATINERASFFGAACWLTYSLEHLLPERKVKQINNVISVIEQCQYRIATDGEVAAVSELLLDIDD